MVIGSRNAARGLRPALRLLLMASQPHHLCSLADVQNATPLKRSLITHALVFENYPLDRAVLDQAQRAAELEIIKVDYFAHDTYDFLLTVTAGDTIELLFAYDARAHEEQIVGAAARFYKELLSAADPSHTIDALRQEAASKIRAQSTSKQAATLAALAQRKKPA